MLLMGSVLAGSSAFSSSDRPFLNDLMPLAKSPISSEILPRPPNNSRPTASTMIQCQMLIEPMRQASGASGRTDPWATRARCLGCRGETMRGARQKQGLHPHTNTPARFRRAAQAFGIAQCGGLSPQLTNPRNLTAKPGALHSHRHPEAPERSEGLEWRRPGCGHNLVDDRGRSSFETGATRPPQDDGS